MATWQKMEQNVRDYLSERFGQPFAKKTLRLGPFPFGRHQFDAVSSDELIVAEVKYVSVAQGAQLSSIQEDIRCLEHLEFAERKMMFLPHPGAYQAFCRRDDEMVRLERGGIELVGPDFLDSLPDAL